MPIAHTPQTFKHIGEIELQLDSAIRDTLNVENVRLVETQELTYIFVSVPNDKIYSYVFPTSSGSVMRELSNNKFVSAETLRSVAQQYYK